MRERKRLFISLLLWRYPRERQRCCSEVVSRNTCITLAPKGGHDVLLRNRVMRRSTAGSPSRAVATFGGASASVLPVRPKQTANIFCVVRAMRNQRQHSGMRAASNPELYKRRLKAALRKRSRGGAAAGRASHPPQTPHTLC